MNNLIPNKLKLMLFLLVVSSTSGAVQKSLTIEEVEEKESLEDFVNLAEDVMVLSKDRSDVRFSSCMKAFGHEKFCGCIKDKLPVYQSFDSYFFIITTDKDELNYANLDGDDKKLVDVTHLVRDGCVKSSF